VSAKDLAGHNLRLERVWRKLVACGISKKHVKLVVDTFRDELLADAKAGPAKWPRVGVLAYRERKPRNIRNPKTHELMRLPKSWALTLRASKHQKGIGDAR
jgi:nucleoid DNA-binding protein